MVRVSLRVVQIFTLAWLAAVATQLVDAQSSTTCSSNLLFSCVRLAEDRATACNFSDTRTTGAPVTWYTSYFSNTSASYCLPSASWTLDIDEAQRNTTRNVLVMATIDAEVYNVNDEVQVLAELESGLEVDLGTIIPRANAVSRLTTQLLATSASARDYPLNGALLCNTLSYQWFPTAHLMTSRVRRLRIVNNVNEQLKLHAVTLDTCGVAQSPGDTMRHRAYWQALGFNPTITSAATVRTGVITWAECNTLCRAASTCAVFAFDQSRSECQLLEDSTTLAPLAAGLSAAARALVVGTKSAASSAFGIDEYPADASQPAWQGAKFTRPNRYRSLQTVVFFRDAAEPARFVQRLELRGVTSLAISVGNTNYDDNSVMALFERHRVIDCGTRHLSTPFVGGTPATSSNATCLQPLHCPAARFTTAASGTLLLTTRLPPVSSACSSAMDGIGSLVMVHHSGSLFTGSAYFFALQRSTTSTRTAVLTDIAQLHSVLASTITAFRTTALATGGYLHTYRFQSDNNVDASPSWRWSNTDRALQFAPVYCEVKTPVAAFTVTHDNAGAAGSRYSCDSHTSLYSIAKACLADAGCWGYTTEVFNGTERPKCLLSALNDDSASDTNFTFFKKTTTAAQLGCSFPTLSATRVAVQVTNALENAMYRVYADGTEVGSCANFSSTPTGDASCATFFPCFSGSIPAATSNLVVRAFPSGGGPLRSQCGHTAAAFLVSFDPQTVAFEPASSCLTNAAPPSECTPTSTGGNCAASRAIPAVQVFSQYCSVPETSGLIRYTLPSSPPSLQSVLTVVGLDGLDAARAASAHQMVRIHMADGSHAILGHIFKRGNATVFVSRGQAAQSSRSLCSDANLQASVSIANLQGFAIPVALTNRGVSSITLTSSNLRVTSVVGNSASGTCVSFPLPQQSDDDMFHYVLPGVAHASPTFSALETTDWAACARACSLDSRCLAYTFSGTSSCHLKRGSSVVVPADAGTTVYTSGVRATALTLRILPSTNVAGGSVVSLVNSVIGAGRIPVLFARNKTAPRHDLRVSLRRGGSVRLHLGQTGFGSSNSYVAIGVGGLGPALVCGNNFNPFDGSDLGVSGACNAVRACPDLRWSTTRDYAVRFVPKFDAAAPTACAADFWGVLDFDSAQFTETLNAISGAEYFQASLTAAGVNSEATLGASTANAVALMSQISVAGTSVDAVLSQRPDVVEDSLRPSTPSLMCQITQRNLYRALPNSRGVPGTEIVCDAHTTIAQASLACDNIPDCVGFSVSVSNDAPKCLFRSNDTSGGALFIFMAKRTTAGCTMSLDIPGLLTIDVAHIGLNRGSGADVVVRLNGIELRRCGSSTPFATGGFVATDAAPVECAVFRRCMSDLVHRTGILTIEFPVTPFENVCTYSGAAFVRVDPVRDASRVFYIAAAGLSQQRTIRSVANPLQHSLMVSGVRRVGVLVQQDRYSCIGVDCRIFFAINVSVGGAILSRCGGSVGFAEGFGLSGACSTYYYCGDTIASGQQAAPVDGLTGPIQISIVEPSMNGVVACENQFVAHVFSDGLMISAQASFSAHRMMYAFLFRPAAYPNDALSYVADAAGVDVELGKQHARLNATMHNPVVFQRGFPVYFNLEEALEYTMVAFDTVGIREDLKSVATGAFACIIDTFVNEQMYYVCKMRVTENHITVRVAQTNYDQVAETVTIQLDNRTVRCGGDQLFFGFRGVSRQCNNYFTCFDGNVQPGTVVTITYAADVIRSSPCTPAAVTLVEASFKEPIKPVSCDASSATPFPCALRGVCLSLDALCDRNADCPDGSDEGRCTGWNYVLSNTYPLCSPLRVIAAADMSNSLCIRHAVAQSATSYTVNSTVCALYTCLDFDAPLLYIPPRSTDVPANATETPGPAVAPSGATFSNDLYIFTVDPSIFRYCTDALHCNNNGRVISTAPPCQCECDSQYIGSSCENLRDISLISQIVVVIDAAAADNATSVGAITAAIAAALPSGFQVSIIGVDVAGDTVALKLSIFDASGVAPSNTMYKRLLTAESQGAVAAATAAVGFRYLTATSVVGNNDEFFCRKTNLTLPEYHRCSGAISINNTRSLTVTLPGITFSAANAQQFVEVLVNGSFDAVLVRCNGADFTIVRNPLKSGLCSYESKCTKMIPGNLPFSTIDVTLGTDINPAGVTCDGYLVDLKVTIDGYLQLPTEVGVSTPRVTTERKNLYLFVAIGLLAVGVLCLAMLASWFKMREKFEAVKYAGPLFGAGAFFFLLFAVCVYAYYLDTAEFVYTHQLVVEEYRDPQCDFSEYSYIPHRISFVPADGSCHQLATIGTPEGISFISVDLTSNKTGEIRLKQGGTIESCRSAEPVAINGEACMHENRLFPLKSAIELHFIKLHGLQKLVAQQRLLDIKDFNPPVVLSSATTVQPLLAGEGFLSTPERLNFFVSGIVQQRAIVVVDKITHFLALRAEDVPIVVRNNASHPRRVVYRNIIRTSATLFERATTHNITAPPILSQGDESNFTAVGAFFNGYQTDTQLAGVAAFVDARYYMGVIGSEVDLGLHGDFTINFWMSATGATRGLVYAVVDNWITTSYESPIISRVLNVIENSEETTEWFAEDWNVYSAVYVNGNARSLHFVWATAEGGVKEVRWDTAFIGVDRIFDGAWHFVSIVVQTNKEKREALLYVDGQTSFAEEGWVKCLDGSIPKVKTIPEGARRVIFNNRQEVVKVGGALVLGYLNAGLYDFHVVKRALDQEAVMNRGAKGMDLYSKIAIAESLALGWITLIFAAVIILYSAYQGWQHTFGITEDDEDETLEQAKQQQAVTAGETGNAVSREGASSAASVQFWQFVQPVTSVAQFMGLYFGGWHWPGAFREAFEEFFDIVSLNLTLVVPDLPVLIWPIVQFFLSTIVLFALLHFAIRDNERHGNVIMHYKETQRARKQKKVESVVPGMGDEVAKPRYSWVIHVAKGKTVPATAEQEETIVRTLADLMTTRHRREANMRLHTKKLINMGPLGTGILLYERINGKVLISFRASDKSPEEDKDAERITVTQTVIEQVAENVECPEHGKRLLPDDLMTAICVHSDNPFYRSMQCPRNCVMYRCPVELCDYAVCEYCYNGGTISGALSGALAKVQELRKHGAIGTVGTFIVLLAGIVYLPVVKNAMMIIFCHPQFQCVFTNCWANPDMFYIIAVLMSLLVVVFIAIGFVVIQVWLLRKRHHALVAVLPLQPIRRRWNFWFLPQNIVKREDYVDYLKIDNSMLKSLYEPFEFSYFWFSPAQLIFKSTVIVALVTSEPNSLTQLLVITIIEIIFAMIVVGLAPYKNVWVESLARLGSFHQLVQLGLMSLHRVDVRQNPGGTGYENQMIAASALYLIVVAFLLIVVVIVPNIRQCYASYKRRRDEEQNRNANENIYDIGFWGNPNRTDL